METYEKITVLRMAVDLRTYEDEPRSVTEIYKELISLIEEDKGDD